MIIWINGAFGSGKTQTAFELQRRLKKSYVYDPEKMGFALRSMIPREIAEDDFQHYPLWREFTASSLCQGRLWTPAILTKSSAGSDKTAERLITLHL